MSDPEPVSDQDLAASFAKFLKFIKIQLFIPLAALYRLKDMSEAEVEDTFKDRFDEGLFYTVRQLPDLPVFKEIRQLSQDLSRLRQYGYLYVTGDQEGYHQADCGCHDNGFDFDSKAEVLLTIRKELAVWDYLKPELTAWSSESLEY